MSKAERVREYVYESYIVPARKKHLPAVTVVSGPVAKALKLNDRMPLVCGAIGALKFQTKYGLRVLQRTGPQAGATATWVFSI